jgi:hypothetical protein
MTIAEASRKMDIAEATLPLEATPWRLDPFRELEVREGGFAGSVIPLDRL